MALAIILALIVAVIMCSCCLTKKRYLKASKTSGFSRSDKTDNSRTDTSKRRRDPLERHERHERKGSSDRENNRRRSLNDLERIERNDFTRRLQDEAINKKQKLRRYDSY